MKKFRGDDSDDDEGHYNGKVNRSSSYEAPHPDFDSDSDSDVEFSDEMLSDGDEEAGGAGLIEIEH